MKQAQNEPSVSKTRLPVIWNDKAALQQEMYRLLLRTLSVHWCGNSALQDKIEKLSYRLAGYEEPS